MVKYYISIIFIIGFFVSCENASKINNEEYQKIIEEKSCKEILNDFYINTNGNMEMIARMVGCTPEEINNIRVKNSPVSKELNQKIHEIYLFYINHNSSLSDLRNEFDPEYDFKDKVIDFVLDNCIILEKTPKNITIEN